MGTTLDKAYAEGRVLIYPYLGNGWIQIFKEKNLKDKVIQALENAKDRGEAGTEDWFIARTPNLMKITASVLQWIINEEEEDMRQIWVDETLQIRARKEKQDGFLFMRKQNKEW